MKLISENICLHTDKIKLVINEKTVNIEFRQYTALKLIMLNAGQVVSKTHIINTLWNTSKIVADDRSLFIIITQLQLFLSQHDISKELIRTVQADGYMFTTEVALEYNFSH